MVGPGQIQDAGVWLETINAYKGDTDKTSLAAKAWRNHIQPGPGSLTMSGSGKDSLRYLDVSG